MNILLIRTPPGPKGLENKQPGKGVCGGGGGGGGGRIGKTLDLHV